MRSRVHAKTSALGLMMVLRMPESAWLQAGLADLGMCFMIGMSNDGWAKLMRVWVVVGEAVRI